MVVYFVHQQSNYRKHLYFHVRFHEIYTYICLKYDFRSPRDPNSVLIKRVTAVEGSLVRYFIVQSTHQFTFEFQEQAEL